MTLNFKLSHYPRPTSPAAIRTGQSCLPTFDTAVDLHHFLETIQQASETGRELPVA